MQGVTIVSATPINWNCGRFSGMVQTCRVHLTPAFITRHEHVHVGCCYPAFVLRQHASGGGFAHHDTHVDLVHLSAQNISP